MVAGVIGIECGSVGMTVILTASIVRAGDFRRSVMVEVKQAQQQEHEEQARHHPISRQVGPVVP